jgi:hypothetical protein
MDNIEKVNNYITYLWWVKYCTPLNDAGHPPLVITHYEVIMQMLIYNIIEILADEMDCDFIAYNYHYMKNTVN